MKKKVFVFILVLILVAADCLAASLSFTFFSPEGYDGKWGDSTLVELPNGQIMLIDTGMVDVSDQLVSFLREKGISRIDHFVISHFHSDHAGGLKRICENFKVGTFYATFYAPPEWRWVEGYLEEKNIKVVKVAAGTHLDIDDVSFDVLWPTAESIADNPQGSSSLDSVTLDVNNHSMVLKLTYGENSALFVGDLYKQAESEALKYIGSENLDSDLLKIPHHGHSTSGSKDFVSAVSPKYAVMMGGVVMTLPVYKVYTDVGCWPFATWMNGFVTIELDGKNITATADKPEINEFYDKLKVLYNK